MSNLRRHAIRVVFPHSKSPRINMIFRMLFLVSVITMIASCKQARRDNVNHNYGCNVDSLKISLKDPIDKTIFVGSQIGNRPLASQVVNLSGKEKYYMLDDEMLYAFNWEDGKLTDSISLEHLGKLNNYSGFNVISENSILLYNYSRKTILSINKKGEVLKSFELGKMKSIHTDIEALNHSRIQINNDVLIASGSTLGDTRDSKTLDRPASVAINVSNAEVQPLLQYPKIYGEANWGGVYMNTVYHTFAEGRYVFYSFPIDHNVYKVDMKNRTVSVFPMGSKYCDKISSSTSDFMQDYLDKNKRAEYYLREHSYAMIMYDEYRKQIIRIAEHPTNKINDDGTFAKPFSIIISDINGKVLSESKIFENAQEYDLYNMHITKQGLSIALIQKNENRIMFKCYKI